MQQQRPRRVTNTSDQTPATASHKQRDSCAELLAYNPTAMHGPATVRGECLLQQRPEPAAMPCHAVAAACTGRIQSRQSPWLSPRQHRARHGGGCGLQDNNTKVHQRLLLLAHTHCTALHCRAICVRHLPLQLPGPSWPLVHQMQHRPQPSTMLGRVQLQAYFKLNQPSTPTLTAACVC